MALEREKEIRADMKQLAASEARVAALEQQLKDKAIPSNQIHGVKHLFAVNEHIFSDYPSQTRQVQLCRSPIISRTHSTRLPSGAPTSDWCDFSLTPSSSLLDDTSCSAVIFFASHGVSTDTTTVGHNSRGCVPCVQLFNYPQQFQLQR